LTTAVVEPQNVPGEVVETPALETPATQELPAIEPVPVPVELPELRYEYQPTDDVGRPLGGKQVLKYRTPDELTQKLVEQNTLLIRTLREEKKKNRLGIQDAEEIPAEAPRFDGAVEFAPRQLSQDESVQLSRDLLDPERFSEAVGTLFEATLGAKPDAIRSTLTNLQETNQRLVAKLEADAFVQGNPAYYRCKDNFETITNWMVKNSLAPVRENFQRAYDVLTAAGLLLEAPIVREEVPPSSVQAPTPNTPSVTEVTEPTPANPQPVQETDSRITVEEPAQAKRPVVRIPSGLTRNQAADAGVPRPLGDDIVYEVIYRDGKGKPTGEKKVYRGLAAINAMPGDEYKRRLLSDPAFRKKAEELEAAAAKRRAQ
jgi:hypothetical protein